MPVNWTDETEVEKFKFEAVKAGFPIDEVESLVEKNRPAPQPLALTETGDLDLKPVEQMTTPEVSPLVPESPMPVEQVLKSPVQEAQPVKQVQPEIAQPLPVEKLEPSKKVITQPFGNKSRVEKYSGGTNLGTDYRAKVGTQLRVPEGEWVAVKASAGFNQGSGNYVQIQNTKTGEKIGFEHLSKIGVRPGDTLKPGQVIGLSGNTGNSTGPHISLPIQDRNGRYFDINQTKYINQIF